ncbi:hypothetical protein I7I50_08418 [Histoplasma capsulatum G186AR]|uniref:Uncharacterized protein n=1 Tax=Ajellomyces capsulatus TaxID=5037 RepID=A0A8H8CZL5_AJECA|nr:hypothetical protein I7I52_05934 [Histoplasma capsulatum]QSS73590.1 hypothetical protein I7I50_08418 [Histoplasma capsulatum G186AR]
MLPLVPTPPRGSLRLVAVGPKSQLSSHVPVPVVVGSAGHYHESINIFQSTKPRNRERGVISIEIRSKKGPPSIVLNQAGVRLSYDLCSLFPSLFLLPFFCFPFSLLEISDHFLLWQRARLFCHSRAKQKHYS